MTANWRVLLSTGLCLSLASFVLSFPAFAQLNTSAISGVVSGSDGKGITGASVSARNEAAGYTQETKTFESGVYSFPALAAGTYTVTFTNTGSKTVVAKGLEVGVARRSVLNARLEAGSGTIEAASIPNQGLEGDSSVLASQFSPRIMADTPLFVRGDLRNAETFVTWLPGVVNGVAETDIAGGMRRGKEVLIGGATATSAAGGGTVSPFPTGGQLSEFRLLTNSLPAEFGRTSGGVEVWEPRRGYNSPHGELFEYLRNDTLDAAGWAVNSARLQKPKLRQNEYGFALGGPVFIPEIYNGRNKSFFNVSLNDYKQNDVNVSTLLTIPTVAMRNGDFSRLVNAAGKPVLIYDPATLQDRGTGAGLQRDPFTDNKIPPSRFSAVSNNVQGYLPTPTNNQVTNNYLGHVKSALTRYAWGARGDQILNSYRRLSVFAEVQKNDADTVGPLPGVLSNGNRQYAHSQMYRVTYQTNKEVDSSNQVTFGYTRARNFWDRQPDQVLDWSKQLGLTGIDNGGSSSFPVVNFTNGYASLGRYTDLETRGGIYDRTMSLTDVMTKIRGRHEIKAGFDARLGRNFQSPLNDNGVQGVFNFANTQTALPSALGTSGDGFASFLLGQVDSASKVYTSLAPDYRTAYTAGFIQDTFRFSPKLTITAGLRYDLPFSRWDNNNTYSSFSPTLANPAAGGIKGAIATAGKSNGHTGAIEFGTVDKAEIGPRIGLAYQLNGKTVIRAGWGILYANGNGLTASACSLCNLGATSVIQRTSNGLTQAFFWDQGLTPPATFRQPPQVDPSFANGGPATYIDPNNGQAPRFQNYSANVQRQLPMGVLLDVAFAGNHGTRLSGPQPLNQVDPKYLAQGALLGLQITDPKVKAAGFALPYAGFTGTLAQALRPYPQFTDITDPYAANLHSDYKALQIKAEKRMGDLAVEANYTYSRATSNGASSMAQTNLLAPQNQYNLTGQQGRSIDDIPQVFNLLYSYELPVGHGKKFLGSSKGILGAVVGGWSVSAQQLYRSGNLLLVTAPNTLGAGVLFAANTQPNLTGSAIRSGTDAGSLDPNNPTNRWLNPAAFSLAPALTLGNAPALNNDVRNPGIMIENFAAGKQTRLREGLSLNYRVEVQNLFNRDLFGNINTNLSSPGFGRATGVMIQPRFMQMSLKLAF